MPVEELVRETICTFFNNNGAQVLDEQPRDDSKHAHRGGLRDSGRLEIDDL